MLRRTAWAFVPAVCFALSRSVTALATVPLPPPEFWPTGGLAVTSARGAQRLSDVVSDDDGGAFVAWTHQPDPYTVYLYLQHLTFQGHLDWDTGVQLGPPLSRVVGYRIVPGGYRGVIATWSDGNNIYALQVRYDGEVQPGWPAAGLRVNGISSSQSAPVLAGDGQGGAYVVWQDSRTRQIYAQHVLPTGSLGWTADGLRVGTGTEMESQPALTTCPDGSVYVAWVAENADPASADIRLNRITSSGTPGPGWPAGGLVLTAALGRQDMPSIVPDGNDGIYAVWRDYRSQSTSRSDVYAQRVNLNTLFPSGWGGDGVAVCTDTLDQSVPIAVPDKQRGVLISWFSAGQVHLQRFTSSGSTAPGWTQQGVSVGTVTATGQGLSLVEDAEGGGFVAWNDSRGPSPLDVYAQHISASGAPAYDWPATGAPVSAASGVEMVAVADVRASTMVNSWRGPIVAWTSGLEGSHPDVYAQRLTWSGEIGPWGRPFGEGCCNAVERLSPNPSRGSVRLQVRIPKGATSSVLDVCDARGRRVRTLPCPDLRPGWGNLVDLDLKGLPSGVYYVKVSERAGGPAVGSAPVVLVR